MNPEEQRELADEWLGVPDNDEDEDTIPEPRGRDWWDDHEEWVRACALGENIGPGYQDWG